MPKDFDVGVVGELNCDLILRGDVMPVFGQVENLVAEATHTLAVLVVTQARSRRVYAASVITLIVSMVASPVLQAAQAAEFVQRQAERALPAAEDAFDPHVSALADAGEQAAPASVSTLAGADTNPCQLNSAELRPDNGADTDRDSLGDYQECLLGTDPLVADSNRDGLIDAQEWLPDLNNDSAPDAPASVTALVVRVTDNSGQQTEATANVTVDVTPPDPTTITLSYAGTNGATQPLTAGYAIRDAQLEVTGCDDILWEEAFGTDQSACVTLERVDAEGQHQAVLLRVQGDDYWDGALAVYYDARAGELGIAAYVPGEGDRTLGLLRTTLPNGVQLAGRARADGKVLLCINGQLCRSAAASASFAGRGGRVGLSFYDAGEPVLDNFIGGECGGAQSRGRAPETICRTFPF